MTAGGRVLGSRLGPRIAMPGRVVGRAAAAAGGRTQRRCVPEALVGACPCRLAGPTGAPCRLRVRVFPPRRADPSVGPCCFSVRVCPHRRADRSVGPCCFSVRVCPPRRADWSAGPSYLPWRGWLAGAPRAASAAQAMERPFASVRVLCPGSWRDSFLGPGGTAQPTQPEGAEVGVAVEVVLDFLPLEKVHHRVCERRGEGFVAALEKPLGDNRPA